jgi:outer membrane receptor for monomeric catechols
LDYSETFLYNEINVSRVGGELVTDDDSTSVSAYGTRTLAATELQLTDDADVTAIATALVAKYKDPMQRITSLGVFLYDTVTISEVLSLDLGYRVRIFRTHPAGGARIDQTAFVQRIQLSSRPGQPITVTLGVSPL